MTLPMSGKISRRQALLAVALLVSLALTLWASLSGDDDAAAQPVAGSGRRSAAPPAARPTPAQANAALTPVVTDWQPVQRQPWSVVVDSQFAAWSPPPPPPAPPVVKGPPPPPAAPVAPAFPYQIIGRLLDGGTAEVFLAGPNRSLNARAGEVIDGQWRVDQVSASGMSLTWLPAQIKQQIAFRALPP